MSAAHVPPRNARRAAHAAMLLAALVFAGVLLLLPRILAGEVLRTGVDWLPQLGIRASLMLDGLSALMVLLISGIGALIFLYVPGYMGGHPQIARFVLYLAGFMVSMLGLVLAGDLVTLFVFWELTALTSWLLIGFDNVRKESRRAALQALLVTGFGGLALLAGLILMAGAAGSWDLGAILSGGGLQDHALHAPILALVLLGAFTKSAQVPFHFWLPNAMAAPTPVSAYLHSATMVKAGVYLLARLHPVLSGTTAWELSLAAAGLVTALAGAALALRRSDLKQALAQTTLMALGVLVLLLSGSSPQALVAALVFLTVHALYKSALFLVVGVIDHATGTREIAGLGGLGRQMPLTFAAALLAAASMAGLPPFLGWIGKELVYAAAPGLVPGWLAAAGLVLANALVFAVAGVVALRPFLGARPAAARTAQDPPAAMLAGPLLLAGLGLVAGLFAPLLVAPLVGVAAAPGAGHAAGIHLWHGIGWPLGLTLLTFGLGAVLFLRAERLRGLRLPGPDFDRGWDRLLDGLRALAVWQTRLIQPGRLSGYLTAVFLLLLAAFLAAGLRSAPRIAPGLPGSAVLWLIAALGAAGALLTVTTRSRIAAVAGVGTVGISVALVFITFGAPDVAITQLMVETLAAVLFGMAMLRLPGLADPRSRRRKLAHAVLAAAVGLAFALTILAVTAQPLDRHVTDWFEARSYALAHGLNVVNVILVDFRAIDTFGEISVVLLASVGAYAALKRRAPRPQRRDGTGRAP